MLICTADPDETEKLLRELSGKFNEFMRAVDDAIVALNLQNNSVIRDAVLWVTVRVSEVLTWLDTELRNFGNEQALRQLASDWESKVKPSADEGAESISVPSLKTDNEWVGRGADAYNERVPGQGENLKNLSGISSSVSGAIRSLADAMKSATDQVKNTIIGASIAMGVAFALSPAGLLAAVLGVVGACATAMTSLYFIKEGLRTSGESAASTFKSTVPADLAWPPIAV